MAKLSGRLRQLRELRERGDEGNISTAVPIPGKTTRDGHGVGEMQAEILSGWKQTAPYVWRKKSVLTLTATEVNLPGLLLDDLHDLHRLTFYDFETTGLSRGAGTVIFLAGFGVLKGLLSESPTLEVEQLLLTDYPGEPEFLHCLLPFLGTDRIFVSYNGKSFDRSILQNRFRMNGIREDMPAQIDLLYPSRRLWGRVFESCSLQYIEREILGFIRAGDIGGALIPECYQEFMRGEGGGCMRGVI